MGMEINDSRDSANQPDIIIYFPAHLLINLYIYYYIVNKR